MTRRLIDYHTHIERGPYSLERLERFLETVCAGGIGELGVSEHGHQFRGFETVMEHLGAGEDSYPHIHTWLTRKFAHDVPEYVNLVRAAKEQGWPVKLGVEVDYVPGFEEQIASWLAGAPWDYVIGSVHFIGKWGFDHSPQLGWAHRDVDAAYVQYFGLVEKAARTGLFDIIGHFDVIKVFGHRPFDIRDTDAALVRALRAIKATGCALDVNTAGWRRPVRELYPSPGILQLACKLRVPITLGSDAHEPEDAGYRIGDAAQVARDAGYRAITRFSARRAQQVPI